MSRGADSVRRPEENPDRRPAVPAPIEIRVLEHPHFAHLDFELRALLAQLDRSPGSDIIFTFFDRGAKTGKQVVLVYQPGRRLLKRLALLGEGKSGSGSRLEIWRDLGVGELRLLLESTFLEKTRSAINQPEVFLGALESLIERGIF